MSLYKQIFLLTSNGIYETNIDFSGVFTKIVSGTFNISCLTNDIKNQYFWYVDYNGESCRLFNTKTKESNRYDFVYLKYVKDIQHDQMTNKAFFLVPITNESVYGNIFTYDPLTKYVSVFNLTIGGVTTSLFYTLGIKVDSSRRKIWVLDSGNKRVLRANLDSGAVDAIFSPPEMVAPCSMTIDFSTGDAYIRCLNGSDEDTEIRETIYVANDNGIISFLETQSFTKYNDSWLSPDLEDIQNIVLSGDSIPLPDANTMKFDQIRNNLWWTSKSEERVVFMANVKSKVMRSISLQSHFNSIKTIELDLDSGEAFVCGDKNLNTRMARINNSCSDYEVYGRLISLIGKICNIIVVQPKLQTVVPFYITSLANNVEKSISVSSGEYNIINLESINNALIAEDEGPATTTLSTPYVNIRVCGPENLGVSTANVWTAKNQKSDENVLTSATSTPKFSWSSKLFSYKPVFVVTTPSGNLLKIEYKQSTNKTVQQGTYLNPVYGEITGLSVCDGDGNAYISGRGTLAKINLDPTTPGNEDLDSSDDEFSSSSDSNDIKQYFASEIIKETEVGGLSVQIHSKSGPVYAISKQDGTLMSFYGTNDWNNKQIYGPLPSPFKAIWSSQHAGIIVACKNSVHLVHIPNGKIETIYSTPTYNITDICIQNGNFGVSAASTDGLENGFFKIVSKDFSSNLLNYKTEGEFPSKACFISKNKILLALERTDNDFIKTRFVSVELNKEPSNVSQDVVGSVSSMFVDLNYQTTFATFYSGEITTLSNSVTAAPIITKIGKISDGITFAAGSLVSSLQELTSPQKKIRVFVGSFEGSNDRWDSGVIETQSEEIVYGGGDNLEPGENYWVTVSIMKENNLWSEPISKQFIVPIM